MAVLSSAPEWPDMDQDPVNNCALARIVEPHAVASWPALERVPQDGWLLRFSSGHSGRANSVATHVYTGRDLEDSVARVEAAYRVRGFDCRVQLTPATLPTDLASCLRRRGYQPEPWSVVMIADAASIVQNLGVALRTDIAIDINTK